MTATATLIAMADEVTWAREHDELAAHLRESATDAAPLSSVVDLRCDQCGDQEFWVYVDETEGYAERNCVG